MFFIIKDTDIASYANNNTPYVGTDNIDEVIKSLEEASEILFKWFNDDLLKSNSEKSNLLVTKSTMLVLMLLFCWQGLPIFALTSSHHFS